MVQYVEGKDYDLGYMKSTKFKILNSCGHQWLRLSETGSKELIMKEIDILHAQSDAEILVTTMQPNIFTPGQEVAQVRRQDQGSSRQSLQQLHNQEMQRKR